MSDREKAVRRRLRDDLPHYAARCLKVRTKAGTVVPLVLNRSQLHLHERLEAQRRRTGRVRALVLKGRQIGISTYIAARYYWRTTHNRGYRTYILAHLDDASDNLFNMAKRFHDYCPALVRPSTGKANAKELSFDQLDSGYKVATAGTKAVGRSDTIQLFHGSEFAFWPNAEEHSAGIMQAIADAAGTEDIRETTANGIGNAFHAQWVRAVRGESSFEAIFIPWFWHEEYAVKPPADWRCSPAWIDYADLHGLDEEQTFWAWGKNREMIASAGGDANEPSPKFHQEYPATPEDAFSTSGEHAFIPAMRVFKARRTQVKGYGPVILGVDPARGGGDKTGIIDRQGRLLGANICKRLDFGDDLMPVAGEIVNITRTLLPRGLKLIAIDTTGLGAGLYDILKERLGKLVQPVNFSARAYNADKYSNRRAEIWDLMREWFEDEAGVQVPDDDAFQGDVCAPIRGKGATRFDSAGRLVLEDKDHIKERLGHSPDLGDAAALTFAADMSLLMDDEEEEFDDVRASRTRSKVTGY
jgi:hypothetical protein